MREVRCILGRRALIVFLVFFVAAGALLVTPVSAQSSASGSPPLLQVGSGDTWTEVNIAKNPTTTPTHRIGIAMATLPSRDVLLFGGVTSGTLTALYLDDTWLFNAGTKSWSEVSTSPTPNARFYHALAATPSGALLFGGTPNNTYTNLLDDTWRFNSATGT